MNSEGSKPIIGRTSRGSSSLKVKDTQSKRDRFSEGIVISAPLLVIGGSVIEEMPGDVGGAGLNPANPTTPPSDPVGEIVMVMSGVSDGSARADSLVSMFPPEEFIFLRIT
jgi:hypothetical protein